MEKLRTFACQGNKEVQNPSSSVIAINYPPCFQKEMVLITPDFQIPAVTFKHAR
jgi:hypothetical protein